MIKNEKIKIGIAVMISLLLFLVFFLTSHITLKDPYSPPKQTIKEIAPINTLSTGKTATLKVNEKQYEDEIDGVISIYDFMTILQKKGKIKFKDKTYTGMGKLIEEINGTKNSGEKNWIYYVNGKKANIGVSNYKINPGDVVSWKYENNTN